MAFSYIRADRDQMFLMPADMREWLPEGHLAWFVVDVVERLDTSQLHKAHPNDGVGRAAYDPDMMLALLVYAYCTGVRSSRKIERLCSVGVPPTGWSVPPSNLPDHSTIARFRQAHDAVAQRLFADALALCAAAGLARVGVVAVDGTRVAANASLRANRSRSEVEAEVAEMFAQAEAADDAEDRLFGGATGDELPPELADRQRRRARLDAALAELATEDPDADGDHDSGTGPGRSERAEQALAELEAELASPDSQLSRAQHQLELAEAAWREREQAALVANRKGRLPNPNGGYRVAKARAPKRDHKLRK